jgi:hypothetical protein
LNTYSGVEINFGGEKVGKKWENSDVVFPETNERKFGVVIKLEKCLAMER